MWLVDGKMMLKYLSASAKYSQTNTDHEIVKISHIKRITPNKSSHSKIKSHEPSEMAIFKPSKLIPNEIKVLCQPSKK